MGKKKITRRKKKNSYRDMICEVYLVKDEGGRWITDIFSIPALKINKHFYDGDATKLTKKQMTKIRTARTNNFVILQTKIYHNHERPAPDIHKKTYFKVERDDMLDYIKDDIYAESWFA